MLVGDISEYGLALQSGLDFGEKSRTFNPRSKPHWKRVADDQPSATLGLTSMDCAPEAPPVLQWLVLCSSTFYTFRGGV
jgi:hypothetical protein